MGNMTLKARTLVDRFGDEAGMLMPHLRFSVQLTHVVSRLLPFYSGRALLTAFAPPSSLDNPRMGSSEYLSITMSIESSKTSKLRGVRSHQRLDNRV